MSQLFEAYDNKLNLNISFGLKFGILLNGLASSAGLAPALLQKLESYALDMLKDLTGLQEVDGTRTDDAEDNELGRLHGSFEILGHISDVFVRRFAAEAGEAREVQNLQYRVINQSGIFAKLNAHKDVSG